MTIFNAEKELSNMKHWEYLEKLRREGRTYQGQPIGDNPYEPGPALEKEER